jgi:fumarate reductase flavoprotein subunit
LSGGIVVNVNGERFTDETNDISGMGRKVTAQPEHYVWFIFDQKRQDFVLKYEEHKEAMEVGAVKKADSVEELSKITKVPADALRKTLEGVIAMQNGDGKDPHGRDFASEEPLDGPPWYVVKSVGALFHTQGGLVIDGHAQVQRESGGALPNLFAAGGTARSTSGPSDWGYIPAAGLFTATTQGRLAGEAAARLVTGAKDSVAAE